jgi:hypothetical protein
MARSLSDDPVKLERERLGLSRRLHAIDMKLLQIKRSSEGEPDVVTGDELHRQVELAKACIGAPVEELPDDVEGDEWGEF